MKTVGIIGGMGPEATLDLFQKVIDLTPAGCDQEHCHLLIDNFPQIPDRTAFLTGKGEDPLPYLLQAAARLERAGVDALCMPCNTAHFFVDEIRSQTDVPFLSILDATVARISERHPEAQNIGLMATRGTLESGIYHQALENAELDVLPLDNSLKDDMMTAIYSVKASNLKKAVPVFNDCVSRLKELGADIMIAGCTEIPLLLPHLDQDDVCFIDPTLTLAEKIVNFALPRVYDSPGSESQLRSETL